MLPTHYIDRRMTTLSMMINELLFRTYAVQVYCSGWSKGYEVTDTRISYSRLGNVTEVVEKKYT